MCLAFRDEELRDLRGDLVRAVVRRATPVLQPAAAVRIVARQPLIADAATHAVAGTQLAHGEAIAHGVAHELQSFVHRNSLLPGHRRTSLKSVSSCRLECYPCCRTDLLPMYPGCTRTRLKAVAMLECEGPRRSSRALWNRRADQMRPASQKRDFAVCASSKREARIDVVAVEAEPAKKGPAASLARR